MKPKPKRAWKRFRKFSARSWINTLKWERSGILDKGLDLAKVKTFAEKTALVAGKTLLQYADKIEIIKQKDRQDIATNADLVSEKIIIEAIEKEFPEHSIFSEEKGKVEKDSDYIWTIDPLDGTKEYVRGIPQYNVAISLRKGQEDLVSVVYKPPDDQLFSTSANGKSYLNGKIIKISDQSDLTDSFVYVYLPHSLTKADEFDKSWEKLIKLSKRAYRLRSLADLNVSCCWVAMGACEGFVNLFNTPPAWDIMPGLFIARQAGACLTDILGETLGDDFSKGIVVTNGKIHQQLLEVINGS